MAKPAVAADSRIVLWNERVAASLNDVAAVDGSCRGGPRHGLNHGCVEQALNRTRTPFVEVTLLDEIALMVVRYMNPTIGGSIARNTRVEFTAQSANIFSEDLEAHFYLKFQW